MPKTATKYKKPVLALAIFLSLSFFVFGEIKKIVSRLFFLADLRYSFDSSMDISGRIRPSIPALFAFDINAEYPCVKRTFVYVIKTRGISVSFLIFFTILKNFSIFAPLFNETVLAFCMTGPSAIGSENGNPNSRMSVPPLTRPLTIDSVAFSLGNPVIMYEISAFSFLDFNSLNLS